MSEHELWNELGNLYFMSGAYNQAAHAYERSIQTKSSFGRPYSNLALTYVQQGKFDEAIDLYRRSIELLVDDKEKAISWNRLGSVYRHLKDYSKAVIAFQEADELDPRSADDFPADNPAHHQAAQAPSSVLDEPVAQVIEQPIAELAEAPVADVADEILDQPVIELPDPQPALEWWDVDEQRVQSATHSTAPVAAEAEDPTTSWTPNDLSQFQQDLSEMPQSASLTTWGDADFEDDFELWSPLDPAPDVEAPDPDSENISTWLPIPEEELVSIDELRVPPFVDELEAEAEPLSEWNNADLEVEAEPSSEWSNAEELKALTEPSSEWNNAEELQAETEPSSEWSNAEQLQAETEVPLEWNNVGQYDVISSGDFAPFLSAGAGASGSMDMAEQSNAAQTRQSAWEVHEVDVVVQERPATDFSVASEELSGRAENETVACAAGPELVQASIAAASPETEEQALDREEEEMHEIEMGIAKFRRVVQLNPRNAHAWDALGTLFKSAGLYKDAILSYQQAISNDPSKSLYYHHLGLVYACEGRDEDAIGAFQRVIEIDPEYSLAHATLGGYYRKMGLEELAQKHIGKAMKNIFDSENEYNRACLQAICGNADQAIELLNVALKNKQTYVDWILRDPDLDFIRQDPRFKQLISDYTR